MNRDLNNILTEFEKHGIYVTLQHPNGLWIADSDDVSIHESQIPFSTQPCTLEPEENHWIARFGINLPLTCNIRGSLNDIAELILRVFLFKRSQNTSMLCAFSQIIGDPKDYYR